MKLQNISNQGRTIFLFCRDEDGTQRVYKDDTFHPFFFEPDSNGKDIAMDGTRLRRVVVSDPRTLHKVRSKESYSSDIRYPISYISNKIDKFEKSPIKYFFIDIEILTKEMPDVNKPIAPVSCITVYNSASKEYKQFYLEDYKEKKTINTKEEALISHFIRYMQDEKPDLWLSWNVGFDYNYMYNRFGQEKFAAKLSPIRSARFTKAEADLHYPDGISVCDYLLMFKKVNMRESSYKLDDVCEKYLGAGKKHKEIRFDELTPALKERNLEDVELMSKLEAKFRILDYFNEIRLFAKCRWEDLTHNSMILDSVLLDEARRRNIVLPNKKSDDEDEDLQGAYRRSENGIFYDIYKADVASMYPSQIVNFCLDPANVVTVGQGACNEVLKEGKDIVNVNGVYFKQDPDALIPYISRKLMKIKDDLKKQLKQTDINSQEHQLLQMKYDAYKGLVNSLYGVMAFPTFRLYNYAVASSITFLSRDLLLTVEKQMKDLGYNVIYTDTDALMYSAEKDEIKLLNTLTQDWGKKYGKESVKIDFESEGKFTKLLIMGKCHYFGYIETAKGIKKEIKGIEIKRSSSSRYEAFFQEHLIEMLLNKATKYEVLNWINEEKKRIKTLDLTELGFPCKIGTREYANNPIFIRAYDNTRNILSDFQIEKGEKYYYIYVTSLGKDGKGKDINVLAFTKEQYQHIDKARVDYKELIRRNIDDKANKIFEAIEWDINTKTSSVATLF